MLTHGNEIIIRRGETWTLSKLIENKDGSPYIISSVLANPYWRITIASAIYNAANRYVVNKWLSLKDFPRFYYTRPLNIADYGLTFADATLPFLHEGGEVDFTGDETSGYANIAIFYEKCPNGVTNYKYWEYINNIEDNFEGKWVDYKCPIITSFSNEITSELVEQNYFYNIALIDGADTRQYLINLAKDLKILDYEVMSNEQLYDAIKNENESYVDNIDVSRPIQVINTEYPILEPTKLSVRTNLKGVR